MLFFLKDIFNKFSSRWSNFRVYSLGNHTDSIVKCFFEKNSYDMITISRNGQLCIWECTLEPKDLVPLDEKSPKKLVSLQFLF